MTSATRPPWLVLTAVAMVALNLRIALSSVPAVTADIQATMGWSSAAMGALTTVPVVCMGAFALLVPRVARRIGRRQTIAWALAILTIALAARAFSTVPGVLPASVFAAGVGIAFAAGLVPSVVREQLSAKVGLATGLWTAVMMMGAAVGGALTAPLADALGSWPKALAIWALPAAVGLVVWNRVEGGRHDANRGTATPVRVRDLPWRDRRAWSLTLYLTCNAVVFYTCVAWLAPSYVARGWTPTHAGYLFGAFTVSQVIAALLLPALAERTTRRRTVYSAMLVLVLVGIGVIALAPDWLTVIWVSAFGVGLGAGFAMGLALLSEFAADGAASARLTAMAFSVTYVCGALGPLAAGHLLDISGSYRAVFGVMAVATLVQFTMVPALRKGTRIS